LIKNFGIGVCERGDAFFGLKPQAKETQALERNPSNAWARKIPALTRPITAVSVSIIAIFLPTPRARERLRRCTVKKIQLPGWKIGID
jgi:hypothetical protein